MEIQDGNLLKEVGEIADTINKHLSEALQQAALAAGKARARSDNRPGQIDRFSATYVVAVGCVSAIHVLASMLGHHGDASREKVGKEDTHKLINPTSTLLAALLVHHMCPSAVGVRVTQDGCLIGQNIEFGNNIILNAIQHVERITGRPVDGYIHPGMLTSVRKVTENADEPMNRFLAQRRPIPGNLH